MGGSYVTIFDRALLSGIDIWMPVVIANIFLLLSIALWFRREPMMPNRSDGARIVIAGLVFILASVWAATVNYRVITISAAINTALRDRTVQHAEGYVTRFKPQFGNGDFMERFCIGKACFSYFDWLPGPGFHKSGELERGMIARVFYTGNNIIRLDIVPRPRRRPAAPAPADGME